MHLVGFIIRIYHDARSPERQISFVLYIPWRFDFLDGYPSRNAAWPTVVALRRVLGVLLTAREMRILDVLLACAGFRS